ncbi:C-5 cytosine-specific DNA methylase [Clostridium sp. C105KSO15]|nr:C-5 cytosine-specific DNA methylase [Clostridium sp. C105KSO15]
MKEMRAYDKANGRTADAVRPRYMVWENVPGAFSSADGEDFRAVLEETCRIADSTVSVPRPPGGVWQSAGAILGPQFSVAWRIYDAQYWSVPQRRKRIFLVADFGGRTAPQILFEQDRLFGDSAPGEETRQGTAFCSETGAGDPGGNPANSGRTSGECLTPWDVQSRRVYEEDGIWPSLYGGEGGGHGYVSAEKNKQITIPINTQIAMRHKRMGEGTGLGIGENGDPAFTLQAAHSHAVFSTQAESNTSVAFACNQRDEVRDLNNVAGAIQAQPGMKQQTFIAEIPDQNDPNCLTPWDTQQERIFTEESIAPTLAGADGGGGRNPGGLVFSAGQGAKAGGIGYQEECSPTLKASESGTNMVPSILCLNDQGGNRVDVTENITATLRAQMDGHPPLVLGSQQGGAEMCEDLCPTITSAAGTSGNNQPVLFENHGIDSRYTGPHEVAPTMSARYGTGGNNVPLISQPSVFLADSGEDSSPAETYCIAGNIIDRQDHNGGNGMGFQPDISYTLNTADRHCVFSQQRSDEYASNNVVSTQSARQYKDATDLVCETDVAGLDCRNGTENGNLSGTLQSKTDGGYSLNNVHPVRIGKLIRRLTPLECERLQGFPDYWTDIPGASDSARYKALGNSVAIPCVEHVLRGIAYFLRKFKQEWEESECIPTSTPTT